MADYRQLLAEILAGELQNSLKAEELSALLETPKEKNLGDLALPCFRLAAVLKKSPQQIAQELATALQSRKIKGIARIEAAGPYLNFFFESAIVAEETIPTILKQKDAFGKNKKLAGKRIMVEYSSPNTNKPLHLGHLRNMAIGMSISRVLEASGAELVKANLVNDRGIHICKSMLAYKKKGKGKTPASERKKSDHFVGDYYVMYAKIAEEKPEIEKELQETLLKWEGGNKETRKLWEKMNKWALDGMKQTYKRYGSEFDAWFFESEFYDKAKPVIEKGIEEGVFARNEEGALVARLGAAGLPDKIVQRKDGTSIYITNDLALTPHKFSKFNLNESIWVVGSEQELYLQQLFKIFELLGFEWARHCKHLSHGMVNLTTGKMKSREGKVVDADDIIEEMFGLAKKEVVAREPRLKAKELDERAEKIALAAIKFFLLRVDARKDMLFNPVESIAFEGETGPYLLYTYARAKSILRKAAKQAKAAGKADFGLLQAKEENSVVLLLAVYPEVVECASRELSPHALAQFLLKLAEAFNSFYHALQVLNAESKGLAEARLALVEAVSSVLKNALGLLGIETVEKM